jgi:hypothetical protein
MARLTTTFACRVSRQMAQQARQTNSGVFIDHGISWGIPAREEM